MSKVYTTQKIYDFNGDTLPMLRELYNQATKELKPVLEWKQIKIPNLTEEFITSDQAPDELQEYYKFVVRPLLEERYFHEGEENEHDLINRVASIVGADDYERSIFYYAMRLRLFLPSSPTLMNAGREKGTLSSCFVIIPEDNMRSIASYWKNMALVQKYGGGVGTDWSALRPEGDPVAGTNGIASGFKPFLKVANNINNAIKQGSARSGANASTMRYDHPDIMDFIDFKRDDPSKYGFFNLSVTFDDEGFMKCWRGEEIDLVHDGKVYETINGRDILERMAENAWLTGDPSPYFIDRTNKTWRDLDIHKQSDPFGFRYGDRISHNPCISGSTMISTDYGYQPIEDLVDNVPQLFVNNKVDYPEDIVLTNLTGEVYTVELSNGMIIESTLDHKFPTSKGELTLEEIIDNENTELYLDLSKKPFGFGGTQQEGEIAGYFAGDGSEYRNRIYLYGKSLDYFGDDFYGYHVSHHVSFDNPRGVVNIGSKFPYELGHSRFVEQYFSMSEPFLKGYLRGLVSADGSVYDSNGTPTVAFHSNNKEFLRDIQLILNQFGIYSKIYNEKDEETKTIRGEEFTFKETFRLLLHGSEAESFIKDIGFSVRYKQKKADELLEDYNSYDIDRSIVTIDNVTFKGIEPVYDVKNMKPSHEFIGNGLRVGNCGEQNLANYGVCNLASVNLFTMTHPKTYQFQWELLEIMSKLATVFLDRVIDVNWFPNWKIEKQSKHLRNVGLGFMGLSDVMYLQEINYDSEEAIRLSKRIANVLTAKSKEQSEKMGRILGEAPVLIDTEHYYRNTDFTCIAPTGSISLLSLCNSGVEPYFALGYKKLVYPKGTKSEEKFIDVKPPAFFLFPDREKPKTSHDISPRSHVDVLKVVSDGVTNAVSKTTNLPNDATIEDVLDLYKYAFDEGVKSITVFRDGCREDLALVVNDEIEDKCCANPDIINRDGCKECQNCHWSACSV